ncbi:MAG: hypothetical protein IIA87_01955, partial [Nanoarchaeota archaeon]|nr:hypothetical protein [Nanoarchaeota archaeon]
KTCSFITGTGPIKDSTGPLIIGHTPGTAGNAGFEGLIDEVEIYSRILTGQEIADKYGAVRLNKLLEYKFDSISGGITPDSSNSGNEGSIRGASLFEDGISFGALEFDGNDLVESKDVDLGGEFSVSTWIFLENLTSEVNQSFQNILDKNLPGSSSFTSYSLRINDNDKPEFLFRPYGDNVQRSVEGSFALKEAKWYLLTATSGDNALKIYVNGELEDTVATDGLVPFDNNYNLIVGGSKLPTSWNREEHYFHGLIDEVIIYDSALSSGLIGTEYKRAMQLHYRLNDDDDEADDRSSYRRDGDIEGAEWDEDFGADGALEFDGDEDYIEIESFNLGRAFSILAWVNPGRLTSSINQSRQTIVSKGEGRDLIYSLSINDDDKIEFLFEQEGSGGTLYFVSDSKVEVGEWSFAAVTLDEREVKLYFNAELEDSDNIGNKEPENSNDKIFVAVEEDGNDFTNELSGILDEIMFFSRGLSVEEIEDIYDDILDEIEDNQGSVARRTSSNATSTCTPDWSCTLGTCVGEIRTHTCRDLNNCGDLTSIPVRDGQTEPCPTSSSTISEEEESSGVIRYVLIGILVLGIMIISAVLILRMLKNRNSRISGYVSRR